MSLAPGTQLGTYEITGTLGKGGMGEVWRARDTKLEREVAIKTLPSSFADDPDRLARFEREAKLLASLNHANIAAIYGLDEHEGTHFLAMELVDGETLDERLKAGALPVEEALRIALQIAQALEAAHASGVIHREQHRLPDQAGRSDLARKGHAPVGGVDRDVERGQLGVGEELALDLGGDARIRRSAGGRLADIACLVPHHPALIAR